MKSNVALLTLQCGTTSLTALHYPVCSFVSADLLENSALSWETSWWKHWWCDALAQRRVFLHVDLHDLTTKWQQVMSLDCSARVLQAIQLECILDWHVKTKTEDWPIPLFWPVLNHVTWQILIKTINPTHAIVVGVYYFWLIDFNPSLFLWRTPLSLLKWFDSHIRWRNSHNLAVMPPY